MKPLRLAIFAHYDRDNRVDDYVLQLLRSLQEVAPEIIIVSASNLPAAERVRLERFGRVVCRENTGYDFLSWKTGLGLVRYPDIYEEIILCNDSVYGPIFGLHEMFDRMKRRPCDLWGITANHQFAFHLQSYFLVFRRTLVASPFFFSFWRDLHALPSKQQVIFEYEIGLTQRALGEGFKVDAYFQPALKDFAHIAVRSLAAFVAQQRMPIASAMCRRLGYGVGYSQRPIDLGANPTHILADLLVEERVPFLKAELFRKNPHAIDLERIAARVRAATGYDLGLIDRHVARVERDNPEHRPLAVAESVERARLA